MEQILVVDDEVAISTHLEERLTRFGYRVVGRASSGEEALARARKLRPDLILMDIVMPGRVDGIEAARAVRKELGIPVVFLTAYGDDAFIRRAKLAEPYGYVIKPFQDSALKAAIEIALFNKKTADEAEEAERRRAAAAGGAIKELIGLRKSPRYGRRPVRAGERGRETRSIGTLPERLLRAAPAARLDMTAYIRSLIGKLCGAYGVDGRTVAVKILVGGARLDAGTALACGLIVSELVTNALKFAFPGGRRGEIAVGFTRSRGGICTLTVRDDGVGLPRGMKFHAAASPGFQVVKDLAGRLGGGITLGRRRTGTEFKVRFKAA